MTDEVVREEVVEPVSEPIVVEDTAVQSPYINHAHPVLHTLRDVDGLPVGHPAEQPRHVIERVLANADGVVTSSELPKEEAVEYPVHSVAADEVPIVTGHEQVTEGQ